MLALLSAAIEDPNDREFMTQFYLEYERLMYATVRKRLTDPEAAKDIVQECIIKLIPKISFLRRQERCIKASYVVSTVRNATINYMRKQGRTDGRCCSLEEQEEQDMAIPATEPIGFNLLPQLFTLSQLQSLYEAIYGENIDKRNFRKRIEIGRASCRERV